MWNFISMCCFSSAVTERHQPLLLISLLLLLQPRDALRSESRRLTSTHIEQGEAQPKEDRQGSCAAIHPAFVARIAKDLAPWADEGISQALMRNVTQFCPASEPNHCTFKYIRMIIKDGKLFYTSIFPRNPPEWNGYTLESAGNDRPAMDVVCWE